MKILMKIDGYLSNFYAQALLVGAIYLLFSHLPIYFWGGIGTYLGFWIFQLSKNKNYLKEVFKDKSPKKVLGLVKGFTYLVILFPIAIPLYLFLEFNDKKA